MILWLEIVLFILSLFIKPISSLFFEHYTMKARILIYLILLISIALLGYRIQSTASKSQTQIKPKPIRPIEDDLDPLVRKLTCNFMLFNVNEPVWNPFRQRYFTIEERMLVKGYCEALFGKYPNEKYDLSKDEIEELKERGILKD
jgi:hypothetical protein